MRHFFIAFAILIVVVAVAFQPSGAEVQSRDTEPQSAVVGDDDLPNGAPVQLAAAKIMPVCIQGPMHATPQCRYNSITECRADCRRKRSRPELSGSIPGTYRIGQVKCFRNPAYLGPLPQMPRALRMGMAGDSIAREPNAPRKL